MKFTRKQLFAIVDGRLSTGMGDVYKILNHLTGENLYTHHLPVAMQFISMKNPDWFLEQQKSLYKIGITKETDFLIAMNIIDQHNINIYIPVLVTEEIRP